MPKKDGNKLLNFEVDPEFETKVKNYAKEHKVSVSQLIRNALIFYMQTNGQIAQPIIQQTQDTSVIDQTLQFLMQKMGKLEEAMSVLLEQKQVDEATVPSAIRTAKELLQEKKPHTYDEASTLIPEINTMTEAINQLLQEGKVQYLRRKLQWQ